jgi:outer membrane lipoprotein-sorting protein
LPLQLRTNNTPSIKPAAAIARRALAVGATLYALGLSACATVPRTNIPLAQAHDMSVFLADRDNVVRSMQSSAVMEYTGGGQHFKARENIVVQRPASMRVEVMSVAGVALVVAADGGQIAVYDPGKDTLMQGAASAATLERFARIPMTPDAATRLLLGLSPDSGMLSAPPDSMTVNGDSKILTYRQPGGVVDELGFDGAGNLEMVRETQAGGRVTYEVHYSDYRDVGNGIKFPQQAVATFPKTGTTVKFHFENPSINQDVPDSTFVLLPRPGTRRLTLGMATHATAAARG